MCPKMSFDTAACAAWLGASVTIAGVDTPLPDRLIKLLVVAFDEPVELEELSTYYESLMVADGKFEATLIQSDV